jgi:hypothetical protein
MLTTGEYYRLFSRYPLLSYLPVIEYLVQYAGFSPLTEVEAKTHGMYEIRNGQLVPFLAHHFQILVCLKVHPTENRTNLLMTQEQLSNFLFQQVPLQDFPLYMGGIATPLFEQLLKQGAPTL